MARLAIVTALMLLAAPVAANEPAPPAGKGSAAASEKTSTQAPASASAGALAPAKAAAQAPAKGTAEAAAASPAAGATATGSTPAAGAGGATSPDSVYSIPAGQEGTVFKSLTVEGEDRVHFTFERPALSLELDPASAPGLDWGSARDVLDRTVPDFSAPLLRSSAQDASPHAAHPWLSRFATGAVARFAPDVKGVERWKLIIVDARGQTVATYEGKGEPPSEIAWDGRTQGGGLVVPGLTYSYVMEARDRAGNKRNFVGQGFQVSAYRLESVENPVMVFSGRELPAPDPTRPASSPEAMATAPILLEAASWLNQSAAAGQPVRVTVTARTADQARTLGSLVTAQMAPHLLGDPLALQVIPEIQPDAPEAGAVRIAAGR